MYYLLSSANVYVSIQRVNTPSIPNESGDYTMQNIKSALQNHLFNIFFKPIYHHHQHVVQAWYSFIGRLCTCFVLKRFRSRLCSGRMYQDMSRIWKRRRQLQKQPLLLLPNRLPSSLELHTRRHSSLWSVFKCWQWIKLWYTTPIEKDILDALA